MKISYRVPLSTIDWSQFKFMVFDVPNHPGTYRERYAHLGTATTIKNRDMSNLRTEGILRGNEGKFIAIAPKEECPDMLHMERFFQDILDKGGEGVILRDPSSPNEPGRSSGFLKHKVQFLCSFSACAYVYIRNTETRRRGLSDRQTSFNGNVNCEYTPTCVDLTPCSGPTT